MNTQEYNFLKECIETNQKEIADIKDNHLSHIKQEISEIKIDLSWVKKIQWYVITAIIGTGLAAGAGLLVGLANYFLK